MKLGPLSSFRLLESPGERSIETMSQAQLIWLRFNKHKLAVAALFLLVVLYLIAVLAEFFAPYTREWRDLNHSYCPPQVMRFDFAHGLHVQAVRRHIDPITFRKTYTLDEGGVVPLGFFVRGEPYELWGLIPMQRHFLGVNLAKRDPPAEAQSSDSKEVVPTFYLLGADKYGRDVLSRMIYGARISL